MKRLWFEDLFGGIDVSGKGDSPELVRVQRELQCAQLLRDKLGFTRRGSHKHARIICKRVWGES